MHGKDFRFLWIDRDFLLFRLMGVGNLVVKKYFIQWDESELKFLLPGSKGIDAVKLSDIVKTNIKLFEI